MKKVLITGAQGQLGSTLVRQEKEIPGVEVIGVDYDDFDLTENDALERSIQDNNIDTLINCAAYTHVKQAEKNPDLAMAINGEAVMKMGKLVKKHGLKWIHISTDYVFDGESTNPYTTHASPNPINVYGRSKRWGEEIISELNLDNSMIIRTSWLFSDVGNNFVNTIYDLSRTKAEIEVVSDQFGSPTYAEDLAKAIWTCAANLKSTGYTLYHFANRGQCSWYEFAKEIVAIAGHDCMVIPKNTNDNEQGVQRPKFSVLDTEKIQRTFHLKIPHWKNALGQCLNKKIGS
jgi:dTDP-4-dehydrorhamnose reductase